MKNKSSEKETLKRNIPDNKQSKRSLSGNTMNKSKGGLRNSFLAMTVLPLIVLGIVIVGLGYRMYTQGLHNEVQNGLSAVGQTVLCSYDELYDGDYNLLVNDLTGEMSLKKGDVIISDDTSYIDSIKEKTGVDITIFFYDKRMMTTICDVQGNRVTDSVAHLVVKQKVLEGCREMFFPSVIVGGKEYFAQYTPVYGSTGACIGMIGAAKSAEEVEQMVYKSMLGNMALIVVAILIVAFIMVRFAESIVGILGKMMNFLGDMAKGNLDARLDETILSRKDEIGEMGRFTLRVQAALKKLIEKDALTGIFNRRSGSKRIVDVQNAGGVYSVAMADIDFFKKVNDTYGHDAGDAVLKEVARILSEGMVGKGFACRWGGEEFLLVFKGVDSSQAAVTLQEILDRIRATTVVCGDDEIKVTMSYGVTTGSYGATDGAARGDAENDTVEDQIKRADNGLYYAKSHGRNQVVNVDEFDESELLGEEEKPVASAVPQITEPAIYQMNIFEFLDDDDDEY